LVSIFHKLTISRCIFSLCSHSLYPFFFMNAKTFLTHRRWWRCWSSKSQRKPRASTSVLPPTPSTLYPTGVPHLQENAPPRDPTVGLCLGSWGGPRGWAFCYWRGTPVAFVPGITFPLTCRNLPCYAFLFRTFPFGGTQPVPETRTRTPKS